jgi:hypothetical protein
MQACVEHGDEYSPTFALQHFLSKADAEHGLQIG